MPRLLIIILVCNCIFSCTQSEPKYGALEKEIDQTFEKLNLSTECQIYSDTSDIYINIFFRENENDTANSYFLDEESNLILTSLINFEYYYDFQSFDSTHYTLSYQGY